MPRKYEREIEEILQRLEASSPDEPAKGVDLKLIPIRPPKLSPWWRRLTASRPHLPAINLPFTLRLSSGTLLAFGLLSLLLSIVVRGPLPDLARLVAYLALGLFLAALILPFVYKNRQRPKWRGRDVNYYYSPPPTIWVGWLEAYRKWRQRKRDRSRFH